MHGIGRQHVCNLLIVNADDGLIFVSKWERRDLEKVGEHGLLGSRRRCVAYGREVLVPNALERIICDNARFVTQCVHVEIIKRLLEVS